MNDEGLLLVKLPSVDGKEYFGIGRYQDNGFVFAVLTVDAFSMAPRRLLPFPDSNEYASGNHIEILGKIENLPEKKDY